MNITEEYDPATDTWTFKASMPTPRIYFGIAVYENRIYCIGGEKLGGITGANEIYDPATDTWETKESMPVAARFQMANIVDGKIYVIGAVDPGSLNQVYDPETDSWTTKTPPPTQIWSLASAVFNDKIYLIDIDGFVQIYDPANDSWSTGAKAPLTEAPGQIYPLDTATAAVTSGAYAPKRIYFFDEAATHVYDPANDRTVGAAMPTARGFAGAVVINDTIYAVGGVTFQYSSGYMGPTAANEQYTPIGYGTVQPVNSLTWLVYAIAAGATASAVAVSAGLIVYFKKHRNQTSPRT